MDAVISLIPSFLPIFTWSFRPPPPLHALPKGFRQSHGLLVLPSSFRNLNSLFPSRPDVVRPFSGTFFPVNFFTLSAASCWSSSAGRSLLPPKINVLVDEFFSTNLANPKNGCALRGGSSFSPSCGGRPAGRHDLAPEPLVAYYRVAPLEKFFFRILFFAVLFPALLLRFLGHPALRPSTPPPLDSAPCGNRQVTFLELCFPLSSRPSGEFFSIPL